LATKVVVCPECSQLVAYGRLSCPSCGAVLAAVEGGEREEPLTVVPGVTDPPRLIPDDLPPAPPRPVATPTLAPSAVLPPAGGSPGSRGSMGALPATTWSGSQMGRARASGFRSPDEVLAEARRRELKPGKASLFADLPFDAPDTLGGWLIALGAALGVVGFLLPWAERMNFALASSGGYFGSWGLAGPGHGFALVVALVTLALAILPTPVPAWVRDSALAPILAGVLLGLAWPYLLGVVQPQIGVLVTTVAAVLLGVGTVQLQRPSKAVPGERHDEDPPPV
jgi:hypothetical protein